MEKHYLDVFMSPRSVAIIGVSRKTGKGSFNLIENMINFGFQGKIYPVNPLAREIMGLKTFRHINEIKEPVDLAVISTPREQVPDMAKECANKGIKGAIVVPQGFADADLEGKNLQGRLTRISHITGMRILGPNTLGIVNAFSGFTSSFMPLKREKVPVGIICQSGIFFVGASLFTGMMGKGIDVANGCDLDFADALDYFGGDDEIQVIFAHIEGMKQGRKFLEVARRVSLKKPIIALKSARTERGAKAALSHSGSLVGKHEVFEAAFRQAGVISAADQEEVLDYTKAFLNLNTMNGNRVGIVTLTGAGGIILIDALQKYGLELAEFSFQTLRSIKELSPAWMPIDNPMDIWPALMKHGIDHVYRTALRAILEDQAVNGVICIAIAPDLPGQEHLDATEAIRDVAFDFPEKPVLIWLYGPHQNVVTKVVENDGCVVSVPTLPRAARTLAVLNNRSRFLQSTHNQK